MNLHDELVRAHGNVRRHHLEQLYAAGVARRSLFDFEDGRLAGHFGILRVELHDNGTYEPAAAGVGVLVFPAHGRGDDIDDLIALRSDAPDQWWLRFGTPPILGQGAVELAIHLDHPLILHGTPWGWLRGGCAGAVVLDPAANLGFWLGGVRRVLATDPVTAACIAWAFRREDPEVRIALPEDLRDAA